MAYNRWEGLIDKFNGIKDLDQKLIRTVTDPFTRFNQDALRILRAIRFSSQLDFEIEEETLKAMEKTAYLVSSIPKERVRQEIQKAILGKSPKRCIEMMIEINLFQHMSIDIVEILTPIEVANLTKLAGTINNSDSNFNKRIILVLNCLDQRRAKDLAKYFNLKKSIRV
jgi:tRNA nucleotidyltransferase (CCA-adding enzyme)